MAADNAPSSNGRRRDSSGTPFRRFERRRPGVEDTRLQLRMRPGAEAARESRRAIEGLAGALGEEQLETLRLLVTELITNAVRHTGTQHWIELDVGVSPSRIHAQVLDSGPGFKPPREPAPHPDRPGGWGLCLVDHLADRWGVAVDDLTCVWFQLDRGRESRFARA